MSNKKSVWLVLDSSDMGGIETHVYHLATALLKKDLEVHVIFLKDYATEKGPHPLIPMLEKAHINHLFLNGKLGHFLSSVRNSSPAVLHSHGYKAGLFVRAASVILRQRHVHTFHAGEKPRGKLAAYCLIDRLSAFVNRENIVVSDEIAISIPAKTKQVDNFIDTQGLRLTEGNQVAFVGRLSSEKAPHEFIELAKAFPQQEFGIYGDGKLRGKLEKTSPNNIRFYGRVNMDNHWQDIKVLVICSEYEGLPMVLLEAMARGIVVVSYSLGQIPFVISNNEDGFIVKARDFSQLSLTLNKVLSLDQDNIERIATKARSKIANKFSSDAISPILLDVYFPEKSGSDSNSQLNVLFVHWGENWIRGSEKCLINLACASRKHSVKPFAWTNSPALDKELRAHGIFSKHQKFNVLLGWLTPRFDFLSFFKQIVTACHLIKKHNIDVIHTNGGAPNQWMLFAARISSTPILTQLHAPYQLRDRITLSLKDPDRVIGVSHAVLKPFLKEKAKTKHTKFKVIYNGILQSEYNSNEEIEPKYCLRNIFHIDKQSFLLVSVGSLIERKGFDQLIHSVEELRKRQVPAELVIIGDGPEKSRLEDLTETLGIRNYIHFFGESKNVPLLLQSKPDLYISGARSEAFGLVFAEAGAAGLASVAPDVGGIGEVIKNNETGILVKKCTADHLVHAILLLYKNPKTRMMMGENARTRVRELFDIENNTRLFCEEYFELAKSGRKRRIYLALYCLLSPLLALFSSCLRKRVLR